MVVTETIARKGGVVVVEVVVVTTGVKHEQACETTELGTPLKSSTVISSWLTRLTRRDGNLAFLSKFNESFHDCDLG